MKNALLKFQSLFATLPRTGDSVGIFCLLIRLPPAHLKYSISTTHEAVFALSFCSREAVNNEQ